MVNKSLFLFFKWYKTTIFIFFLYFFLCLVFLYIGYLKDPYPVYFIKIIPYIYIDNLLDPNYTDCLWFTFDYVQQLSISNAELYHYLCTRGDLSEQQIMVIIYLSENKEYMDILSNLIS